MLSAACSTHMSGTPPSLEEALFDLAVQKPDAAERAAFLDSVCQGNPGLRSRLEQLLKGHFADDDFLTNSPKRPEAAPVTAPLEVRLPPDARERMIGRYRLLERIGEGGFGEVWMAEQREPVKRRVALKIIKAGMVSGQAVARLMDHPNIARVFDGGTTEIGRPYFVMELVRGSKLTDYCDKNQLPMRERLQLFIKVCQAIQHAHQKGIIHRDIKPSNILVTLHDGVPVPKVIDFGIAKATQQELTDKTLFTQFQQFIGTPAYISPEQAETSGLDIDTRSDIYSLGVLLYELLVGRTPFDPAEMMKGGLDALRRVICEKEPVKPSTKLRTLPAGDLTTTAQRRQTEAVKLTHQLRGDLDWIILKCLEKDRNRRYETANGLAADIQRHLAHEPIAARPPSTAYRIQKAWQRNKVVCTSAAMVAVALVAGTGVSIWQAVRAKRALRESESITEFLSGMLRSPDPALEGRDVTVLSAMDRAVENLERDAAIQPDRRARLQVTLGVTYRHLGMPLKAIPLLESARDHYQLSSGLNDPDTLNAMQHLADSYRAMGRQEEAVKLWEQALAGRREVLGPEHPDTLTTMESLSTACFSLGRQTEAVSLGEDALRLRIKVHGREHLATLSAMHTLAFLYAKTGRPVEAARLSEEVVAGRREQLGAGHADTLSAMVRLAEVYGYADRRDKAYPLFKEVLPLLSSKFGPDHPETVNAATHLGRWCSNWAWDERVTNPERARELASEGERLVREALPVFEWGTSTPPYHLACIRSRLGAAVAVAAFTNPALTPAEREQKMTESETLMQRAQTAIGGDNLGCQRDAIVRFIQLYEAWPKPDKLAEWQRRLEAFDRGLAGGK
jgi:serine/threonine protein kinase